MGYRNIDGIPYFWCGICQKWMRVDRTHKCEPPPKIFPGSL